MSSLPFPAQVQAVEAWLDGPGAAFAQRIRADRADAGGLVWLLVEAVDPVLRGTPAHLVLPSGFPAEPAKILVDKSLCLILPHVEANGHVCLGETSWGEDYERPCQAVIRTLHAFADFVRQCADPDWVEQEFQNERSAYWLRFCASHSNTRARHVVDRLYFGSPPPTAGDEEGDLALFLRANQTGRRTGYAVASLGSERAETIAARHGFAGGTLVRGRTLAVRLAEDARWTPSEWPTSFESLCDYVGQVTGKPDLLTAWCSNVKRDSSGPLLLTLHAGSVAYAYQISPSPAGRRVVPALKPLEVSRIDSAWALARDHEVKVLSARRRARILVLGCGSLGSPLIELLARGGIGHLDIVDHELFAPENCARHVLGMSAIDKGKAAALADRLIREVPGITIRAFASTASRWILSEAGKQSYNLILDSTGESSVRGLLGQVRNSIVQGVPIAHCWLEPYAAAAHLVYLAPTDRWPADDPADSRINIAAWSDETLIKPPACGAGFHPYGAADAWQAAAFACERVFESIGEPPPASTVWSWIRSRAYFAMLPVAASLSPLVPDSIAATDSICITRRLSEALQNGSKSYRALSHR